MVQDLWWYNQESSDILNRGYLLKGETVEDAIHRICLCASKKYEQVDKQLSEQLYHKFVNLIKKGYMSVSSPIWANMGTERGLPISCFNVNIYDHMNSITDKLSEVIIQTKIGGGTSGYFGKLRHRGAEITNNGKSSGAVSFMKLFDSAMDVVSQGSTRRGGFAAYLDIEHPDIEEFLQIKDIGNSIQNLFFGVCVSDEWMQQMIDGDDSKRSIWAKVLQSRQQKGLPYILFKDTINNNKPQIYKDRNLQIYSSNLCSEIALPSTEFESFICCLSSMNLELYDEWKDTDAVEIAVYFLDAVLSEFITNAQNANEKHLKHSWNFATRHRAIGLGVLGYHSYLQKNMIPFESFEAKQINAKIFKQIHQQSFAASVKLGMLMGVAPIFNQGPTEDFARRNTTTMAIAPTTSSSAILGQVSAGIEPYTSNYYKVGLAKGNFMRKNKYLKAILNQLGKDTDDVWDSIRLNNGSVQHLDFLTNEQKQVFKTFKEIEPIEIITQAAQRQQFIDQAQSLNINIPSDIPIKQVNKLIIEAWKLGVKTLYYQRSQSASKEMVMSMVCSSCEA